MRHPMLIQLPQVTVFFVAVFTFERFRIHVRFHVPLHPRTQNELHAANVTHEFFHILLQHLMRPQRRFLRERLAAFVASKRFLATVDQHMRFQIMFQVLFAAYIAENSFVVRSLMPFQRVVRTAFHIAEFALS
jgi:hypothetical protein